MSTVIYSPMKAPVSLVAWEAPEPAVAFARLQGRRGIFWLDSSRTEGASGRYSILGCEPFGVFQVRGDAWEFSLDGQVAAQGRGDPGKELERRLGEYGVAPDPARPVPFCGGAVGFLGYELGAPGSEPAADGAPDAHLGWYDAAAVWDHVTGRAWLVGAGWRRPAERAAAELGEWLGGSAAATVPVFPAATRVEGDFTRERYEAAVRKVRGRIAEGEIYQMNLAQRFTCPSVESPAHLYRRLRDLNPAPMGAYLEAGDWTVLSSSPERFIEVEGGRIRTFPVKGTRPRGRTPAEDEARRRELAASEKERAELLMIVDLMRNDLGRVCRFGTVQVRRLHDLETFATVHHLVGEVEGELRPDVGTAELLRAVFPGGSITGAPKVRAQQVIAALEPVARGIFSGSIGYWSACGRIDLNIAIRTIVCHRGQASFHVGAGIVWDSDPAFEYEETLAKGEALLAALGGAWPEGSRTGAVEPAEALGVFETVRLAEGQPVFFAEHAARFAAGCAWFGLIGAPTAVELRAAATEAVRAHGITEGVLRWSAWAGQRGRAEWSLRVEPPRAHQLKPAWRVEIARMPLPALGPETACKHLGRKPWREALAARRGRAASTRSS